MSEERVLVRYKDFGTFEVNRFELAKELKGRQRLAQCLGRRPGQPIGGFGPSRDLSSDLMATVLTIVDDKIQ